MKTLKSIFTYIRKFFTWRDLPAPPNTLEGQPGRPQYCDDHPGLSMTSNLKASLIVRAKTMRDHFEGSGRYNADAVNLPNDPPDADHRYSKTTFYGDAKNDAADTLADLVAVLEQIPDASFDCVHRVPSVLKAWRKLQTKKTP